MIEHEPAPFSNLETRQFDTFLLVLNIGESPLSRRAFKGGAKIAAQIVEMSMSEIPIVTWQDRCEDNASPVEVSWACSSVPHHVTCPSFQARPEVVQWSS